MPPKSRRRKADVTDGDDDATAAVAATAVTTSSAAVASSRPSRGARVNYAEDKKEETDGPPGPKRGRKAKATADDGQDSSVDVKVEVKDEEKANDTKGKKGRGKKAESDDNNNGKDADKNEVNDSKPPKGKGKQADDKDDVKPKTSGSGKGAKKSSPAQDDPAPAPVKKSIVLKSKAPVDSECSVAGSCHVLCEGDDIWDCMLNQTDVGNNNNKYYLIQCLESDAGSSFYCWQRWGRVGKIAGTNLVPCGGNKEQAKQVFKKKFLDKTKNQWENRDTFSKVSGKYDLLQMDYAPSVEDNKETKVKKEEGVKEEEQEKEVESKLDEKIQDLIKLIFDVKKMTETVVEMQYDANKAPLGKLTKDQIRLGYEALKVIEESVVKGKAGSKQHIDACNQFYTRIPHDFGMKRPPLIRDMETIKNKITLLEVLGDIQIAMTLMSSSFQSMEKKNMIDHHYDSLKCAISSVDKNSELFSNLNDYVQKTHGKTHTAYTLDVQEVFELDKGGEKDMFNPSGLGNRRLLWHGSRLTNWSGILGQGLRIAPPEAPVTGYMFGKGVYFADMCTKSANYCFTTPTKNTGLILLCEVALGEMNELTNADYNASSLPKGKHSTWGKGRTVPNDAEFYNLEDGTVVPSGVGTDCKTPTSLQYNEFIVYNTNQIRMRYLIKLKFNYKYKY